MLFRSFGTLSGGTCGSKGINGGNGGDWGNNGTSPVLSPIPGNAGRAIAGGNYFLTSDSSSSSLRGAA